MPVAAQTWFTEEGVPGNVLYTFLETEGDPLPAIRERRPVIRPGVDNRGHFLGGERGEPFELITKYDEVSVASGKALQALYRTLEGTRVDLFYQSSLWATVYVYEAKPLKIIGLAGGVGGFNNGSAIVPTKWKLRAIA